MWFWIFINDKTFVPPLTKRFSLSGFLYLSNSLDVPKNYYCYKTGHNLSKFLWDH